MKYNIISIDDARQTYKEAIRERVLFDETFIPSIDASEVVLEEELGRRNLAVSSGSFNQGEIGVWLSTFDCWQWAADNNEELIVFEDDAIPTPDFHNKFAEIYAELTAYDFCTLWVPPNQYLDYIYDAVYSEDGTMTHIGPNKNSITSKYNCGKIRLARAYNGYGNVAQLYSPRGARRFINLARVDGITQPVDCWVYLQSHLGKVEGFAPKPNRANLVDYDWPETQIHNTENYAI